MTLVWYADVPTWIRDHLGVVVVMVSFVVVVLFSDVSFALFFSVMSILRDVFSRFVTFQSSFISSVFLGERLLDIFLVCHIFCNPKKTV